MNKEEAKTIALAAAQTIEQERRSRESERLYRREVRWMRGFARVKGYRLGFVRPIGKRRLGESFRPSHWMFSLPDGQLMPDSLCAAWILRLDARVLNSEGPGRLKFDYWYRAVPGYMHILPTADALASLLSRMNSWKLFPRTPCWQFDGDLELLPSQKSYINSSGERVRVTDDPDFSFRAVTPARL